MNSDIKSDKQPLTAGETDAEARHRLEVRRPFRPALLALVLSALLVVALGASLFWTARQIRLASDALDRSPSHSSSLRPSPERAVLLRRRAGFADAAQIVPAVLVPAILVLLAFAGFRVQTAGRELGGLFIQQIAVRQEQVGALRRRDLLLSATVGAVGDAVIAADIGGRITLLNPAAERLTAWHEADALGRELKAILTLVDEQTGSALTSPSTPSEIPPRSVLVARRGERRPVTGHGTLLWDEAGQPGGVALTFQDVSELRQAADALRHVEAARQAAEAYADSLLEVASECTVLLRPGGEIAGFNPAAERIFGWTRSQAVGRIAADLLFPASARDSFRRETQRPHPTDSPRPWADTYAQAADGRVFPAEMKLSFISGPSAPLTALHLRDVSDRREAEGALRRARDAARDAALAESLEQSALLANMSDEFRTPLNAVIGYSEMLQEEAQDRGQEDLVPDLQKIHGAGKHLLSLINDVLDLSKIESGQMELFPETFDVAALLEEVVGTIRPAAAQKDNTLQVRVADGLGALRADRVKVKQSLLNLLSNAAGFSHGRILTLEAGREQDGAGTWITFRLSDVGTAQGQTLQRQLLETAPELDSTAPRFSGHGLALVIAHRFCQMQGGEFTGSREPGHGAVYRMRFPVQ